LRRIRNPLIRTRKEIMRRNQSVPGQENRQGQKNQLRLLPRIRLRLLKKPQPKQNPSRRMLLKRGLLLRKR